MLQVKEICKQYKTGDLVQQALDHVSLNLRDNEFVAILGPSGSGKTTLLNIIGGLDRYDSGDLIINGISTKKYKDRDWDSYRNHTIGFVFQSYNLIPHQTVLANVELALTISGISGSERRQRAEDALKKVGLGEQMHKKPNQMSGGQMQRVAIARALVNNPDILLADEPTGALDSETSVQVMDLLKEVAKDRLVVMVTHNPDLAYQYANRIINLKDGRITADSNPLTVDETAMEPPKHKNLGKASMSFLTALSLSFNNLMTKKARTILVAFAGSIGIIGIALIMSLSNGVNAYIKKTEQESLAEYPLEIDSSGINISSLLNGNMNQDEQDGEVKEKEVVSNMFARMTSNDLASLKEYIDSDDEIKQYARSIEYRYSVVPRIYRMNGDEVIQVNPNDLLASSGIAPTSSAYSSSFSMNVFSRLPQEESLYEDGYEVKAGRWPQKYNELVVVLDQNGAISDMLAYTLGLKDYDELKELIENAENGTAVNGDDEETSSGYSYDQLLGKTFRLVNAAELYTYDDNLKVWTDRSDDQTYLKNLVENGDELKIVGIVQPAENSDITMLSEGIGFRYDLTQHIIKEAASSEAVKAQLSDKDTNIFTGQPFGSDTNELDLSSLFSIDENAMQNAFSIDTSRISTSVNPDSFVNAMSLPDISEDDLRQAFASVDLSSLQNVDAVKILEDLLGGYFKDVDYEQAGAGLVQYMKDEGVDIITGDLNSFYNENESVQNVCTEMKTLYQSLADQYVKSLNGNLPDDIGSCFLQYLESEDVQKQIYAEAENILKSLELTDSQKQQLQNDVQNSYTAYAENNGYPDVQEIFRNFQTYIQSDGARNVIMSDLNGMIDMNQLEASLMNAISSIAGKYASSIGSSISSVIADTMSSLMSSLTDAFSFNADAFRNAIVINISSDQLQEAVSSMMSSQTSSYENNLQQLGYADLDDPATILIYPNDFDAKAEIKTILDNYNQTMENNGEDDKVISYTDMVATLMTSVTRIVNTVSWALIAFVAISLVVSSIMIGVITYISVLERRKEIGILRAIGASKHNVSEVFNAETFITGLLAGTIGVGIALILLIPGNYLIRTISGRSDIRASLPAAYAAGLILLSVFLTLISGLIPARKAANSDPVTALRTE